MKKIELQTPTKSGVNGFHSPAIRVSPNSESVGYTSLKDILQSPLLSPPERRTPMAYSPTASSSFQEIPIKNPLVKHAAIAYLQPMSNQTAAFGARKGLFTGVRENCGCDGDLGCVSWLCEVVSRAVRDLFGDGRRSDDGDDDNDEK